MSLQPVIDTTSLDEFVNGKMVTWNIGNYNWWEQFFEEEVALTQEHNDQARRLYKQLTEKVIERLNYQTCWDWHSLNSGSMFDQTKVDEPDEFDCLFIPKLPPGCIEAVYGDAPPGFCYIYVNSDDSFLNYLCGGRYLSATKWRNYFTPKLQNIIINGKLKWKCQQSYDGSAAVPVKCVTGQNMNDIDIDLVPALHVSTWPPNANKLAFLETLYSKSIIEKGHHVVAKVYKEEHQYKDFLWRLAFNNAEKQLTKFADPEGETCRKKVLRIVKRVFDIAKCDLDSFKTNSIVAKMLITAARETRRYYPIKSQQGPQKLMSTRFCTYDIRSLMWSIWYESDPPGDWSKGNIRQCRQMVLQKIKKMLSGELLVTNFFIKQKYVVKHLPEEERKYFYTIAQFAANTLLNS